MRKLLLLSVIVGVPMAAFAASVHIGENYFLKGAETAVGDIYAVGPSATFAGTVEGDAIAFGKTVLSESDIRGDALFAGERVFLLGAVSGDARLLGGEARVGGEVKEDAVIIGGKVSVLPEAALGGNLYIIAGAAELQGAVGGSAKIVADTARISGTVGGDLETWGTVEFESGSRVSGDFIYHAESEKPFFSSAPVGGRIIFVETKESGGGMSFFRGLLPGAFSLILLMALALGFFLFFAARERTEEMVFDTLSNFWQRMLRGALIAVLLPLFAFFLGATVVGFPLAVLAMSLFFSAIMLAAALAGIVVGARIEQFVFRTPPLPLSYRSVLLGIIALYTLFVIPYIGIVVYIGLLFAAVGSIGTVFYRHLRQPL